MIRRILRLGLRAAVVGGAGYAVAKVVKSRRSQPEGMPSGDTSIMPRRSETPLIEPNMLHGVALKTSEDEVEAADGQVLTEAPPAAAAAEPTAPKAEAGAGPGAWVEPDAGICPTSHPVKAKLASGIFHLPGMLAYDRTTPDRCYRDEESAVADGLRKARR